MIFFFFERGGGGGGGETVDNIPMKPCLDFFFLNKRARRNANRSNEINICLSRPSAGENERK